MQNISFCKLPEYYQSMINNSRNKVLQNLFSKINFLYFPFDKILSELKDQNVDLIENYLSDFLSDFKFIVYQEISSNFENTNKLFPKENSSSQNVDAIFCVESNCIIIEKINFSIIFKIINKLKNQQISLIDISSATSNGYDNEIREEISNFCLHFNNEIRNNQIVKSIIQPIAGYFIRRYFYPTKYFKDQSFFIFNQSKEEEIKSKIASFLHSNDKTNIKISYSKICNEIKSNEYYNNSLSQNKPENSYTKFYIKDFIVLRLIYTTSKCSMFLVIHIESLYIFLMKTAPNPEEKEINFCKKYSHRCFTKFYGFLTEDKKINGFIYEFMSNGSLSNFIKSSNKDKIDDIYSLMAIIRIFEGIEYLQSNSLIHRDLKPLNILIDHDYIPYISDFETIRYLDNDETETTITNDIGSYLYSSPEQYQGEHTSFPTDIYSFGLIIYFIIEKKNLKDEKSSFMKNFSQNFQNLVDFCTEKSPNDRPLIKEIQNYIIDEVNFFHDYEKYLSTDIVNIDFSIIIQFIYENIVFQKEFQEELNKFLDIVFFIEFIYLKQTGIISESKNKSEILNHLGDIYYFGYGVEQDYLEAKKYYELSANLKDPEALNKLGMLYSAGHGVELNYTKAKKYYELSAKQNDSEALLSLGIIYLNGYGVEKDYDKAIYYINLSIKQNNSNALLALGQIHEIGSCIEQDYSKAKECYELAAQQNNSEALFRLGYFYELGLGVEQNLIKAKKYYELSAQQNDLKAIFHLEYTFNKEESCKKKLDLDMKFLQNDDASYLIDLGNLYFHGKEIEQNYLMSKNYYELAARKNNSDALGNLGILYMNGFGVKQNYLKAKKYFDLLAKQNNYKAFYILGYLYYNGLGVDQDYSKAKEYYEMSANQNNDNALLMLGNLYYNGQGVDQDYSKAKEYYEKSANQNNDKALLMLGNLFYNGQGVDRDYSKAKEYYEMSANQNNDNALLMLGNLYYNGQGVNQDYSKAKEYYEKSANQNNDKALLILGYLFYNGQGVGQDYSKAKEYFELSAKQNNDVALLILGSLYFEGKEVKQNYSKAKEYYELSAKQNNDDALRMLGTLYYNGQGVDQDYSKAKEYYEKSANQNNDNALLMLGNLFYNGQGVDQNYSKAKEYYEKSANQNNDKALLMLGNLFYNGQGVDRDYSKAKEYYEMSADQNNDEALLMLGNLYFKGQGVNQDYSKAKEYYEKSANQNNDKALLMLGNLFYNGQGVDQNYSKAKEYYEKSANQNNADAIFPLVFLHLNQMAFNITNNKNAFLLLGFQYCFGLGVEKDSSKSIEYLESSFKLGNYDVCIFLGLIYFNINEFQKAIKHLEIYIEHNPNNSFAYYIMGNIYEFGLNDNLKAKEYYELSAKFNFPIAFNKLGDFYKYGKGVKIDIVKANDYYSLASNQANLLQIDDFILSLIDNSFEVTNFSNTFCQILKYFDFDQIDTNKSEFLKIVGFLVEQLNKPNSLFDFQLKDQDFLLHMGYSYLYGDDVEKNYLKAKKYFELLAQQNNSEALYMLGYLYQNGYGVKQNYLTAKEYYELAAKQNNSEALLYLGELYENGYGVEQNYLKAKELYESSAKQYNSNALINLGRMYENGYGVKTDYSVAIKYYELSAEQKNSNAQYILGTRYENGKLVKKNYSKAKEYYELSAKQDNSDALFALGALYHNGYGVEQSYSKAKKYYELSAQQNDSDALYHLGLLYEHGNGVERDYSTAIRYYELSAQQNNSRALTYLGCIYSSGRYFKEDYLKAKKYFELASQLKDSFANIRIGHMYFNGLGVDKNIQIALKYFEINANQGDPYAFEILGDIYYLGDEVKQDYLKAKEYYEKSTRFNNSEAYYKFGKLYMKGRGVEQSYLIAKKYFEYASQLNSTKALFTLGYFYSIGYIFDFDIQKSINYLEKCSEIEEEENKYFILLTNTEYFVNRTNKYYYRSNNDLGLTYLIYFNNIEKAHKYLNIAGLNEYPYGQNNLGLLNQFYLDNIINAEYLYERASKHNFSLAEYNLGYIKEKENKLEQAIEFYIKAAEHENEPLMFHNHRHFDVRLETSKIFVICFTNLKLADYYLSKDNFNEAKKFFIKSFDKLELKDQNSSYNFRFIFNKEDIKNSFEYLKSFVFNCPLFNLFNQNLNFDLKFLKQNEINNTGENVDTKKQIDDKKKKSLSIIESDKTKSNNEDDKKNNILKDKSLENKIKSNELKNRITTINQFNDISISCSNDEICLSEQENVFNNPSKLFDFVILNEEIKKNFIDEIKEIIQIMKKILYTPPYAILFGRINIEQEKNLVEDESDTKRKDIDKYFYEGFGIDE